MEIAPVGGVDGVLTFHDSDKDRMMRQYLGNGAVIELSKATGVGNVYFGGEAVARYEDVRSEKHRGNPALRGILWDKNDAYAT